MEHLVEISESQAKMAFVATCIEGTANKLGLTYKDVYDRMMRTSMIDKYIYPCYDTLHTESRNNVINDMIECLKDWEEQK